LFHNASFACFFEPHFETTVRVQGRAYIPAFGCVRGPRPTHSGGDVGEDARARRGKWCAVKIEGAVDLCPGGETRVDARAAKEIQSEACLEEESIP
jgi:hypothetical protein